MSRRRKRRRRRTGGKGARGRECGSGGAGCEGPRAPRRDTGGEIPLFDPRPDGPAERFLGVVGDRHPVVAFFLALISGYLLLAAASVALGFLVTEVLLLIDGVERFDERFPRWLAGERTDSWTDASWWDRSSPGAT